MIKEQIFFFFLFRAAPEAYGSSQARGWIRIAPQTQQTEIQAAPVTYTADCGNVRSLIHWVRPRIKPTSSRKLHRVLNQLSCNGNSQMFKLTEQRHFQERKEHFHSGFQRLSGWLWFTIEFTCHRWWSCCETELNVRGNVWRSCPPPDVLISISSLLPLLRFLFEV